MDDLISRQAAINAIMDADVCVTWNGVISDDDAVDIAIKSTKGSVISSIVNMPSAQPETHEERTETHACDCISRKEAIDAMESAEWYHQNQNKDMVRGANSAEHQAWYKAEDVYRVLEQLPYAQPEIIRCKECVHADEYYHCDYMTTWNYGDCFCSYGKRRVDVKADKGSSC